MCLIGKTGLLCMQCRGIEPHFPTRGMSHTISRVAAGTWGIFASYNGDDHPKLHLGSAKSGLLSSYDGHLRNLN